MAKVMPDIPRAEIVLGVLHDVSNSITSLSGAARTLVEAGDRMDGPLRGELGELVLRQVTQLCWLTDAMRGICDEAPRAGADAVDTAYLVRSAAAITGATVKVDGSASFSGDFERIRLGIEALLDAVARTDSVISLDAGGRTLIVRSGPVDLSFGGVRWRLALAHRLLGEAGIRLSVEPDNGATRCVAEFPKPNVIRL